MWYTQDNSKSLDNVEGYTKDGLRFRSFRNFNTAVFYNYFMIFLLSKLGIFYSKLNILLQVVLYIFLDSILLYL